MSGARAPISGKAWIVWWCWIVGHRWADWTDNANRQPCLRCWERRAAISQQDTDRAGGRG